MSKISKSHSKCQISTKLPQRSKFISSASIKGITHTHTQNIKKKTDTNKDEQKMGENTGYL